jgi:hypothetical protein
VQVRILEEHGYDSAMLGLSLSHNQDPKRMPDVAQRLAFKGDAHNKFLESLAVWLDIDAPRYWWQQFDTYRAGVTKQSESTMHTLTKQTLSQEDFEHPLPAGMLAHLNDLIQRGDWEQVKWLLPESFLQRRVVCLNYMVLQRMIRQREAHRLEEWHFFSDQILAQVRHPQFLKER